MNARCRECVTRLLYSSAFGGVVTMTPQYFTKVNGYSLQFFGWGGEDDDMGNRYVRNIFEILFNS